MRLIPILLVLPLAAQGQEAPVPVPIGADDTCAAAAWAETIGLPLEEAMEVAEPRPEGWRLRVIRPGEAVTADLIPTRLNVFLGEGDVVGGLSCT